MSDRSGKRVCIYGASGSGKSYFAKSLIRDAKRIVAFDPEGEYGIAQGFHVVEEDLGEFLSVLRDCQHGNFRVSYVPREDWEEVELHEVSRALEWLQAPYLAQTQELENTGSIKGALSPKVTLLVDELSLSYPNPPDPHLGGFSRICGRGRKRGINVIGITQRPADVATRFRGNLSRLHVFGLSTSQDFKAVREVVGPEGEAMVRALGEHEHVLFENGSVTVQKPV